MEAARGRLGLQSTYPTPQQTAIEIATNHLAGIDEGEESANSTSALNSEEVFPRRSLRKQGIGPLDDGIPYYESTHSNKRRISSGGKSDEDSGDEDTEKNQSDKDDNVSDTEHNVSSEATVNANNVTGKGQSFMVKNLLDLKSPQDSIPPVDFSTPATSLATTNGPTSVKPTGSRTRRASSSSANTSKQVSNVQSPLIISEVLDASSRVHNELPSVDKHQLPSVDKHQLREIFQYAVQSTRSATISHMEQLHNCLEHAIFRHRMEKNKNILLEVSD